VSKVAAERQLVVQDLVGLRKEGQKQQHAKPSSAGRHGAQALNVQQHLCPARHAATAEHPLEQQQRAYTGQQSTWPWGGPSPTASSNDQHCQHQPASPPASTSQHQPQPQAAWPAPTMLPTFDHHTHKQYQPSSTSSTHLDLNVGGLALGATQGLVDHDAAVGQRVALALVARGQQEGAHRGGQPHAHGGPCGSEVATCANTPPPSPA